MAAHTSSSIAQIAHADMQKIAMNKKIIAGVVIAAIIAATIIYDSIRLRGHGRIKTINIDAYKDEACTIKVTEIDWGTLSPSDVKTAYIYLKNTGNSPVDVTVHTEKWSPAAAEQYMTFSWNFTQTSMQPSEVVYVELKLKVAANITGVNSFQFDIVITAAG